MSKNSEKNWIPIKEAVERGLVLKNDGSKAALNTAIFWARATLDGKKPHYFLLPNGYKGVKQSKRGHRPIFVHIDALPFICPVEVKKSLTDHEVLDMIGLYERGSTITNIAHRYAVPYNTAYKIVKGLRRG